jgi:hypothetical protein
LEEDEEDKDLNDFSELKEEGSEDDDSNRDSKEDEGTEDLEEGNGSEVDDGSDISRISKGLTILKHLGSAGFAYKGFYIGVDRAFKNRTIFKGLSNTISYIKDFLSGTGVFRAIGITGILKIVEAVIRAVEIGAVSDAGSSYARHSKVVS